MNVRALIKWNGCFGLGLVICGRLLVEAIWPRQNAMSSTPIAAVLVMCWWLPVVLLAVSGLRRGNDGSRICGVIALCALVQFAVGPLLESGRRY